MKYSDLPKATLKLYKTWPCSRMAAWLVVPLQNKYKTMRVVFCRTLPRQTTHDLCCSCRHVFADHDAETPGQGGRESNTGGQRGQGGAPDDLVREGELDLGVVELLDVVTLALGGGDGGRLDDLDAGEPHPVAGPHLLHPTPSMSIRTTASRI